MNFFGGQNCGNEMGRDGYGNNGMDCCSLIFLILLLQNCGGFFGKCGEISIDIGTILLLILLSNCGFGCSK